MAEQSAFEPPLHRLAGRSSPAALRQLLAAAADACTRIRQHSSSLMIIPVRSFVRFGIRVALPSMTPLPLPAQLAYAVDGLFEKRRTVAVSAAHAVWVYSSLWRGRGSGT